MSPFVILGLGEMATTTQVKVRWRELAGVHHPDKGGDADEFQKFNKAYKAALLIANEPKVCGECRGTGKVTINHGFSVAQTTCPKCGIDHARASKI
jgi:DnaJ-class molecular chaperone